MTGHISPSNMLYILTSLLGWGTRERTGVAWAVPASSACSAFPEGCKAGQVSWIWQANQSHVETLRKTTATQSRSSCRIAQCLRACPSLPHSNPAPASTALRRGQNRAWQRMGFHLVITASFSRHEVRDLQQYVMKCRLYIFCIQSCRPHWQPPLGSFDSPVHP